MYFHLFSLPGTMRSPVPKGRNGPRRRAALPLLLRTLLPLLAGAPLMAQQELSLTDAVEAALAQHPALRSSQAAARGAEQRVDQARAGRYPAVNYSESLHVGNNPVYVFGSLLEQHRFGAANFAIDSLNRPAALSNFASQLSAEQVLYDGQRTSRQMRLARTGAQITAAQSQQSAMDVLQNVLESYFQAVLAQEQQRLAEQMLAATEADLARAEAVRDAGMSTEADVLALRAERAAMQDRLLMAGNAVKLAQARLNDAMGAPLESEYRLSTPLHPAALPESSLQDLEVAASGSRPELRQAQLAQSAADEQRLLARSAYHPQLSVFGAYEANRKAFLSGGGTNWMTGVMLNWNLFRGFADRAREQEAIQLRNQREHELRAAESGVRLEVRQAYFNLQSAGSRIQVAEAAIASAEQAHRIAADRYAAGLATVTELLRSQTALLDARTRRLGAIFDQRMAAVRLERAVGSVSARSAGVLP